jgi:lipoic acid synthetase
MMATERLELPPWFRQEVPDVEALRKMGELFRPHGLHTVCEGAKCPNLGRCWNKGTATFMILGGVCTRACGFCAVTHGVPVAAGEHEPARVAEAARALGLKYVVITSVTRDDLPDEGSGQFVRTTGAVRALCPSAVIEVLTPDFSGRAELVSRVVAAGPDVFGHNLETVRRIAPFLRSRADHERSLAVLKEAKGSGAGLVKSGLMVGLGETDDEVLEALAEIRGAGADIVTVGQYLSPTKSVRHAKVARFVPPDTFDIYRREAMNMGFLFAACGPLVRSSYLAHEGYAAAMNNNGVQR